MSVRDEYLTGDTRRPSLRGLVWWLISILELKPARDTSPAVVC